MWGYYGVRNGIDEFLMFTTICLAVPGCLGYAGLEQSSPIGLVVASPRALPTYKSSSLASDLWRPAMYVHLRFDHSINQFQLSLRDLDYLFYQACTDLILCIAYSGGSHVSSLRRSQRNPSMRRKTYCEASNGGSGSHFTVSE